MSLNELHTVMKSLTLPNQLMRPGLLVKEISPYQLARQCKALHGGMELIQAHSGSSGTRDAQWGRWPSGGSIRETLMLISPERLGVG